MEEDTTNNHILLDVITEGQKKTQSEWMEEILDVIAKTCKNIKKQDEDVMIDGGGMMRRLLSINKQIRFCVMREYSIRSMLKQYFWLFICGVVPEMEVEKCISSIPHPTITDLALRKIVVSPYLFKDFVDIAKPNLDLNLEIGAVLAGTLDIDGKYHITALLVPAQKCQSFSYEALNEDMLHIYCITHSLIHIGEIHTHPSQKCQLSSIDLHNHYWFQNELPEAISVVVAPNDSTRRFGVYRITNPKGMSVLRKCNKNQADFHYHETSSEPIYNNCSEYTIFDPNIRYSVVDFR